MEFEEKEEQKLDLFVLLDGFLKEARRKILLLLILALLGGGFMAVRQYRSYYPRYTAYASFTVRVANPLYSSVTSYNAKTAEQMAKTFPYILTSGVLQERVKSHLGIAYMPPVSVTTSAGSNILTVKVTDSDGQRAYDVLNAVITYYPEIAEFVVGSTVLVLLDESGVPTQPVNALDLKGPAVKGVILGVLVWVAILALIVLSRNTVHNEEELKKLLNTPCLGQIPSVKMPRNTACPVAGKSGGHTGLSEAIRLLRLRVEKYMEAQKSKVLLISSAVPGEGKTTVSVNLAISLAKKGKRVVLIDCDMRNPSVAKALQLPEQNALSDYLQGKAKVRDIVTQTQINNLFVIAGGSSVKTNSAELLSQERTFRLIQAARNLFDYVILDTPPCSLLTDASELAELADCSLMVIRQDFASKEQIVDGMQRLGDGNLPVIGCALNDVRRGFSSGYGYGYGYGYGHGYGYGYGEKKQ